MQRNLSIWEKLKAYRLENNVYVLIMLVVSVLISLAVYVTPFFRDYKFVPELALACGTSLLATIFVVATDVYVKYQNHKDDQFLEGVHEFGISNLHFNKQKLLEDLLGDCEREIWISGYRLILTRNIANHISDAVKRGATVKIIVCPPWREGFKSVYGEHDKVLDNYFKVFQAIARASHDVESCCEVRFTSKPIFNDTYKVDGHLITGPYMHNRDEDYNRITANDFFTYDLVKKSRLYRLVENEYETIWEEAEETLVWSEFKKIADDFVHKDLREREKIELMRSACVSINEDASVAKVEKSMNVTMNRTPDQDENVGEKVGYL